MRQIKFPGYLDVIQNKNKTKIVAPHVFDCLLLPHTVFLQLVACYDESIPSFSSFFIGIPSLH